MSTLEVQDASSIFGCCVPDPESVVFGAGDEMVCARVEGETRDVFLVAFKIAEVGIVMGGEVADCIF